MNGIRVEDPAELEQAFGTALTAAQGLLTERVLRPDAAALRLVRAVVARDT